MDAERANAMHRYFLSAQADVADPKRPFDLYERIEVMRDLGRTGVSFFEADALLAIAQHPFASDWARERYGHTS